MTNTEFVQGWNHLAETINTAQDSLLNAVHTVNADGGIAGVVAGVAHARELLDDHLCEAIQDTIDNYTLALQEVDDLRDAEGRAVNVMALPDALYTALRNVSRTEAHARARVLRTMIEEGHPEGVQEYFEQAARKRIEGDSCYYLVFADGSAWHLNQDGVLEGWIYDYRKELAGSK